MTVSSMFSNHNSPDWSRITFALIVFATLARILALLVNPLSLHADETQYWIWSQTPDWGYFSKPPMIAWMIGLSTGLFGDAEWAVRLPAPFLHAASATFLFLTARQLWEARTGFWVALLYLTLPAVWLSSSIMSTDALLLCAWSGALYSLVRLRDGGGWVSAIGLGTAIGLGFLSKYAMIYFLVGSALGLVFDRSVRMSLISRYGLLAAVIAGTLIAPNVFWNADNDFATVSHTAANANWGGQLGHPDELADFLSGQLGVFGPVLFPVLCVVLFRVVTEYRHVSANSLLLAGFVLPPLLIVSIQAFISRAHANWAAAAYIAASLLVVVFLLRGPKWRRLALTGSIAFHTALGLSMAVLVANPALVEAVGASNATKRIRAWHETADAITAAGMAAPYTAIVFDDRNVFHQMQRYATGLDRDLRMWLRYSSPVNHAEQTWPLADDHAGEVLIISHRPLEVARMREDFENFEPAGAVSIALDGNKTREFTFWRASAYRRVERTAAYEEHWRTVDAAGD